MDASIASTAFLAQQAPGAPPAPTANAAKAAHAAKEYEGIFIAQLLGSMFQGIKTDGMFGGGQGEEMFRSLLVDQYAKGITDQGGFGLAAHMQAELLQHQQVAQ
ncbi:MAG: rod-binding protein [Alphaproteobacteria bacterium]|nr:rod-binding protein [Alphaproteobacteria bacterium]